MSCDSIPIRAAIDTDALYAVVDGRVTADDWRRAQAEGRSVAVSVERVHELRVYSVTVEFFPRRIVDAYHRGELEDDPADLLRQMWLSGELELGALAEELEQLEGENV